MRTHSRFCIGIVFPPMAIKDLALVGDALSQNERLAFFGRRPRLSWAAPAESLFVMKTPSSRPGMTLPHAMKRIGTESRALEMRPSCC